MYHAKNLDGDKEDHYSSSGKYSSLEYHNETAPPKKDDKEYQDSERIFQPSDSDAGKDSGDGNEDVAFKAARQIFNESKQNSPSRTKKKPPSSIEIAIKNAIEEEKNVLIKGN